MMARAKGQDVGVHGAYSDLYKAEGSPTGLCGSGDSQFREEWHDGDGGGTAHLKGDDRRVQLRSGMHALVSRLVNHFLKMSDVCSRLFSKDFNCLQYVGLPASAECVAGAPLAVGGGRALARSVAFPVVKSQA